MRGVGSTSNSVVRVGVVGLGEFGRHHVDVFAATEGCAVVAVADTNASRAADVAAEAGVARWYASADDLLRAEEIDAVSVVTSAAAHVPIATRALRAGVCVLLEKPAAQTRLEADALVAAEATSTAFVMPAHILRFSAAHRALRDLVAGCVSPPLAMSFRRHRSAEHANRFADVHPVLMTMIHDLDLAYWLADVLTPTWAWQSRFTDGPCPNIVQAHAVSNSGISCTFETSWLLAAADDLPDAVEVFSQEGVTRLAMGRRVTLTDHLGTARDFGTGADVLDAALCAEIRYFVDCVRAGTPPTIVTLADAALGVDLGTAIVAAATRSTE